MSQFEGYRIILLGFLLSQIACSNTGYKSAGSPISTLSGVEALNQLNLLELSPANSIDIHFDRVDYASQLMVTSELGIDCAADLPCPTPRPVYFGPDSISGPGSISANSFVLQQLYLAVAFSPKLASASECLALAEDAEQNGLQFDLVGSATLLPIPVTAIGGGIATSGSGSSSASPGAQSSPIDYSSAATGTNNTETVFNGLVSQATSVQQGYMTPPIFIQPWAGLVITSITSCTEGAPIDPPPLVVCTFPDFHGGGTGPVCIGPPPTTFN